MSEFTPREIVSELDRYIIGQNMAKRAVAIALRNRWRRQRLSAEMREEVYPKNILMIGPTGVGKTEIARRLAKLARAPFIKVEATKFTEVGYVGRDVESIVRDLVEMGITMVTEEAKVKVQFQAEDQAEERLLDILLPLPSTGQGEGSAHFGLFGQMEGSSVKPEPTAQQKESRQKMRKMLREGKLDDREIDIDLKEQRRVPMMEVITPQGMEGINLQDMLGGLMGGRTKTRRVKVGEAMKLLTEEEAGKLVDQDTVQQVAIERVEQSGIVFLDELDKVCARGSETRGGDVSREGVQRDLLPLVEGTTVSTKYGMVKSDHILFIASGAFQLAKPSDLLPELQGRLPIRVELESLGKGEFVRILTEPENALTRQYAALMGVENIELVFTDEGIEALAEIATRVNETAENIGARRLHTVMEKLLDELSFSAPDRGGERVVIDAAYVNRQLSDLAADEDLSRFIL
ncbi:heat shock protein HslVU, ATPase subunit HslU [Magnetococcus marinus MC-1]|uniref:ATP-dependent protease ATPase subunit HslU n=1 Tax=Magnetococcus marinus (strain ATCC BAA-1437 / JCM 17883 / MC-1) TaxID=156889 RepID=HSLU_MAGMM|nr:ATP-dependent protease ATPase subunit HslU [Magnetococcus marinus]A0L3K1.1 RecName: Full=ATP-dependent protease ATPase subunit HslU; AltName: Full=Unfoldase HslU [Magnetococcus marinus MC-1]ABK42544.1 heat shock protein HslVU, ATPase subunit HslU [Magnetococcus marinus MC-1]